jgi:hypothetical protein
MQTFSHCTKCGEKTGIVTTCDTCNVVIPENRDLRLYLACWESDDEKHFCSWPCLAKFLRCGEHYGEYYGMPNLRIDQIQEFLGAMTEPPEVKA